MTGKFKKTALLIILFLITAVVILMGFRYFPLSILIDIPIGKTTAKVIPNQSAVSTPNSFLYDFELREGEPVPGVFYTGIAHSGKNSVKAFGQNSFSYTVEHLAGSIGTENLREVSISAWVYVFPTEKEVKGSLVFTASNAPGVNVCWEGIFMYDPEVPRGKWFKVSGRFDLSKVTFRPDTRIKVYFWNTSDSEILIDDYFMVFGGEKPRRGDSALVDLTRTGGFVPRFNYPPFPVNWFVPAGSHNPLNPGDILPDELLVAGDFFGTGNDGLLVFGKNSLVKAFSYCPESMSFVKHNLQSALPAAGEIKALLPGRFSGQKRAELLLVTEKMLFLTTLTLPNDLCNPSEMVILQVISSTPDTGVLFAAGQFSGHDRTELLTVHSNGTWTLRIADTKQSSQKWKLTASSDDQSIGQWHAGKFNTRLTAGPFLAKYRQELLLSVSTSLEDGTSGYSISRFIPGSNRWIPVNNMHFPGITAGMDSLKPENQFCFVSGYGSRPIILRYDRSWRYDLKEIGFNDTTYVIRHQIDFSGFNEIMNPKFYESLRIIPVSIKGKGITLLLIGHNAPERRYSEILPDFSRLTLPLQQR